MTNITKRGQVLRSDLPMNDPEGAPLHAGWEDARKGLPHRPEYDAQTTFWQINYERGRQMAALTHRNAGGTDRDMLHHRAPKWRRNERLPSCLRRAGLGPTGAGPMATFVAMTETAYARWFS